MSRIEYALTLALKQFKLTPEAFAASQDESQYTLSYDSPVGNIEFELGKTSHNIRMSGSNLGSSSTAKASDFPIPLWWRRVFVKKYRLYFRLFNKVYAMREDDRLRRKLSYLSKISDHFPDAIDEHLLGDKK